MLDCGGCVGTNQMCSNHACVNGGCTPQTSCAIKGFTCGVIYNGCAPESCGSGPPLRDTNGDSICGNQSGHSKFYGCLCAMTR